MPLPAPPVVVDNYTKRSDADALYGGWVQITATGPGRGVIGKYVDTVVSDPTTGYPTQVLVRGRDITNQLYTVNYTDIKPVSPPVTP